MTRQDCIKALQKTAGADAFITMKGICIFTGIRKPEHAKRFVEGCTKIDDKYYFIPEVADRIMLRTGQKGAVR